jgi:hypothetical protein
MFAKLEMLPAFVMVMLQAMKAVASPITAVHVPIPSTTA